MNLNLLGGVRNKLNAPLEALNRNVAKLKIIATNRDIPSQRALIENLLEENEFLLIIFDSCRFDFFENQYSLHYTGKLQRASTTNTYTKRYQTNIWPDEYDLTYVAGGPVISDRTFGLSNHDYRPSEHFDEIVPVWDMDYEKELGVTPPEAVTDAALERDASRMVVHYFQPHAPYIGESRLRDDQTEGAATTSSKIEIRAESLKEVYELIENERIDESTLHEAYASNLSRVMEAAKPLVDHASQRTVITSDHGELLGEDGRYMHGGAPHPVLCEVPWLKIENVVGEINNVEPAKRRRTEKNVKEQLQDLGYM
jgi:hypothetical protein